MKILDKLPIPEEAGEVRAPDGTVTASPYQIIVPVSLTAWRVLRLPPDAPRFPAVFDTGNNDKILTEAWLVSPESVAEALERLYTERELLEELSEAAYRNATRPEYRWAAISERWDALFREVLG